MTSAPTELRDCPAPAKLNLFLHVVGRRPDGYHLLQTVFQLIDWCDTLHFSRRADGRLARTTDVPLHAGEVITTGTVTDAAWAYPGDEFTVEIDGAPLVPITLRFA